jgi:formylglycine-generating enzyme required for sulfatase activity
MPEISKVGVPNGKWIEELQIFADQTEIANIHWIEYCKWLKENAPNEYLAALPDTTVWADFSKEYLTHYYSYSGFRFFPVVGISYQQAQKFCQWRSKIINEANKMRKPKGIYKDYDVEITYRLPTEKEWTVMAQAQNQDAHGFAPLAGKYRRMYPKDYPRANTKRERNTEKALITEFIFVYSPNIFGIYNIIGNVSEMVQEEGVGKGGSWAHTLEESAIAQRQTYTTPTNWLGFRCVATVKLTPKAKL